MEILETMIVNESRKVLENMIVALDQKSLRQGYTHNNAILPTANETQICFQQMSNNNLAHFPTVCVQIPSGFSNTPQASNDVSSHTRDLFSWCPVKLEANGACCIAGLCRSSESGKQCELVVTDELEVVSCSGKSVKTVSGLRFRLHGSISWSTHCLIHPSVANEKLPPELESAFLHGFPKSNWRDSIQDLYFFSIQPIKINTESAFTIKKLHSSSTQLNDEVHRNPTEQGNPYHSILESYKGCGNLHTLVDNAIRKSKRFLQLTDLEGDNETPLSATPIVSDQPPPSPATKPTPLVKLTSLSPNTGMDQNSNPAQSPLPSASFHSPTKHQTKQRPRNSHLISKPTVQPGRRTHGKYCRPKVRAKRLLTSRITQTYQLQTESGQTVDVRDLKRTRSGRWVLPKLDANLRQAVVIDRNKILGVAMHDDL